MKNRKVPEETVSRLPVYLRVLTSLSERNRQTISSDNLAKLLGVNPWQIRKDFAYFGDFGVRGRGYKIETLKEQISRILGLDIDHNVALVGAGNLGSAVLSYPGFRVYGFNIVAAFDADPAKIGKTINNVTVEPASNIRTLKERKIRLAIIAVPAGSAQQTADALVAAGVRGILNFSPHYIAVPKKIKVITIDIALDLARLPYHLAANI